MRRRNPLLVAPCRAAILISSASVVAMMALPAPKEH
jgi:hypothetical protein